ncbi:Hemerythrin HHE cation binding domain protein [Magnetococcus marinus MC-1]|uniref:Hemerythrin HHE cation binding domain protein n=1 Tax=Magnetococcus marinus (strain ATCC BAA-1437 / JCM 17883 / MC-1) TaxID=156889 RepID=A0L864_MAGMM|nr:hemerythrin domain-containing protein [Magnetococcus marinus]ABK44157.1 Hemerythrin HHE cation binding domain protein [Magnetococcus marinus MC-1]
MKILDLTHNHTIEQAMALLQAAFDALPAGETMVLLGEDALTPLVEQFQDENWGAYEWYPLSVRRGWRISLHKRAAVKSPRQVAEYFTFDHRRCDDLYAKMENAADDAPRAMAAFQDFDMGMLHHFRMEEEVIFPAFERKTGMTQGPTMIMRMEHQQMRGLLAQMREFVLHGNVPGMIGVGGTLLFVMQQHNMKEEQMLYPMTDMHLGDEVDTLIKGSQKLNPFT